MHDSQALSTHAKKWLGQVFHLHSLLHSVLRVKRDDGLGGDHVADLGVVQDVVGGVLLHGKSSEACCVWLLKVMSMVIAPAPI
jgi:hypothetical protein